jgi:hypothetical protein
MDIISKSAYCIQQSSALSFRKFRALREVHYGKDSVASCLLHFPHFWAGGKRHRGGSRERSGRGGRRRSERGAHPADVFEAILLIVCERRAEHYWSSRAWSSYIFLWAQLEAKTASHILSCCGRSLDRLCGPSDDVDDLVGLRKHGNVAAVECMSVSTHALRYEAF